MNCVSVLLHVCGNTHVSLYTWRSEDNLRSCSFWVCSMFCLRHGLSSAWNLQVSSDFWPVSIQEAAYLCLPSCHYWEGEHKPQHMAFGVGCGKQTQALMREGDHLQTEPSSYTPACKIWLACWKRCWDWKENKSQWELVKTIIASVWFPGAVNSPESHSQLLWQCPLFLVEETEAPRGGWTCPAAKGWTRDHMLTIIKAQSLTYLKAVKVDSIGMSSTSHGCLKIKKKKTRLWVSS